MELLLVTTVISNHGWFHYIDMSSIRDASDKKLKISCIVLTISPACGPNTYQIRDFTLPMPLATVTGKSFNGKFTARVFYITIAYADIGSLKSKVSPYII